MIKLSHTLENGILHINGSLTQLKDAEISKVIQPEFGLAVEVNKLIRGSKGTPPRNVFLLDDAGKIIWQIEEFKFGDRPEYFSNIWLNDKGQLMAFVPKGFQFVIDMKTGKLTEEEFVR